MIRPALAEPLEARIAPALTVVNPLPDIIAGAGSASVQVELGQLLDPTIVYPNHTLVTITLNLDSDPNTPGLQTDFDPTTPGNQPAKITIELFDDQAPLTVQNFLRYLESTDAAQNYLDTFFHRLVSGFVLQGGGFDFVEGEKPSKLGEHIPTFSDVHNEFDASRSNVRGTIAMAKTGLSPNSATSEWFINLADNSQNLDNQNGGFTVFGEIVEGMNFIDRIAQFATPNNTVGGTVTNAGGALTSLPVQNFTSGEIGRDNVIRVTDVQVVRPGPGNVVGTTFEVVSINAPGGGASTVVTGNLNASKLTLNYAAGMAGEADVTIRATKSGETVDEVFRVTVLPNLVANITKDPLPNLVVLGDDGVATVKISNTGAGHFSGAVNVKFYLSPITNLGAPADTVIDSNDILIGQLSNQSITLMGGGEVSLSADLDVSSFNKSEQAYRLTAKIETVEPLQQLRSYVDDDVAYDGGAHGWVNGFGNVTFPGLDPRVVKKLSYTEADGTPVMLKLNGPGMGKVIVEGDLLNLEVTGTNVRTSLSVKTNGDVQLNDIHIASPIGSVKFGAVQTTGFLTASGGIRSLTLGDVSGDGSLVIGAFVSNNSTPAKLKFGSVTNFSIESAQPIASLRAEKWLDTGGNDDTIVASSIGRLSIDGDFQANVRLLSDKKLGAVSVKGFLENATFQTLGDIAKITVGGVKNSNIFAGTDARPNGLDDFTSESSLGSFTVKGIAGQTDLFVDTQIAASKVGKIMLRGIAGDSGDSAFGVVADQISRYQRIGTPSFSARKIADPGQLDVLGQNYSLTIL